MSADLAPSPDDVGLAEEAAGWRSAYVHLPFCRRRCPYCDFAVVTGAEWDGPVGAYVDAVLAEIAMEPMWAPLDAVNLGGGTPTTLPPEAIARILDALLDRFGLAEGAEVSIEANPEDWTDADGERLVEIGFTRISLGVQSFDDAVLRALGREHDAAAAIRSVEGAHRVGFPSVSLDLIFGTPGESSSTWAATLQTAFALEPDHVSTYALTVEKGTALSRAVAAGAESPDPDDQADKYEAAVAAAAAADLVHYEVSNFARPGHPCRYNLATWAQGEYVAFGLGAHGHRGGVRTRNVRRIDAYLAEVARGERPLAGSERIEGWRAEQERLLLGLRRRAGVRAGRAGARLLGSRDGERLVAAGVLTSAHGRLVVTRPLLSDEVSRAVLALDE